MILMQIVFWLSVWALFHTYVFYPLLLRLLASSKSNNTITFAPKEELPFVSVVMSLYNEETVIAEKLQTLIDSNYPKEKLQIWIGSDCSDDQTNTIVSQLSQTQTNIHFYPYTDRRGKPSVINQLVATANKNTSLEAGQEHILIISDANVMLATDTIFHLVKHFKNKKIGLVDSNIQAPKDNKISEEGIADSEKTYISGEVKIKNREGKLWGRMMGPLGGCYAIRIALFEPVPANYLVDDFYIAMKVFEKGGLAINDLEAVCFESVPNNIAEEFRRKSRISAGNFTNLATFKHLLWPPTSSLGFAFLSHKVLRWLGPFFILLAYFALAILGLFYQNLFYLVLFILMGFGLVGIPLLDWGLQKLNLNVSILRYITYFNAMNLALFNGFIKYIKGVQNGIWQPTKRKA